MRLNTKFGRMPTLFGASVGDGTRQAGRTGLRSRHRQDAGIIKRSADDLSGDGPETQLDVFYVGTDVEHLVQPCDHQWPQHHGCVRYQKQPDARCRCRFPDGDQDGETGCGEETHFGEVHDQLSAGGPQVLEETITQQRACARVDLAAHREHDNTRRGRARGHARNFYVWLDDSCACGSISRHTLENGRHGDISLIGKRPLPEVRGHGSHMSVLSGLTGRTHAVCVVTSARIRSIISSASATLNRPSPTAR